MATICPLKTLADFRDHLARHDKPLAFLFGAGTSCAINVAPDPPPGEKRGWKSLIPATAELTKTCKAAAEAMGDQFKEAWQAIEGEVPPGPGHPNIEDILSLVRTKKDAVGNAGVLSGLNKAAFTNLEAKIRDTIVAAVTPDHGKFPAKVPHDQFAVWVKHATRVRPVEVFTTNYDTVIEQSMERANVPVFDGFVGCHRPFFMADSVERDELLPGKGWLRFWKIHGSVNWHLETTSSSQSGTLAGCGHAPAVSNCFAAAPLSISAPTPLHYPYGTTAGVFLPPLEPWPRAASPISHCATTFSLSDARFQQ